MAQFGLARVSADELRHPYANGDIQSRFAAVREGMRRHRAEQQSANEAERPYRWTCGRAAGRRTLEVALGILRACVVQREPQHFRRMQRTPPGCVRDLLSARKPVGYDERSAIGAAHGG